MDIYMDIDYVRGQVIDAHFEGRACFSEEEKKHFQTLLKKDLNNEELTEEEIYKLEEYKEEILASCELMIDWYDIDEIGNYHWEDCLD